MSIITKIFGDPNEREIKKLKPIVEQIGIFENELVNLSNDDLKKEADKLKEKLKNGASLDDILPRAFALVRESGKRTLGQRHFDVQLIGGIVLHQGKIAEMRTGEGKTLSATLPAFLNSLTKEGVHIITVNDYLAKRDAVWMGQIYDLLGISVSCVVHDGSFLYSSAEKEKDKERDIKGGFKVLEDFLLPVSRKEAYSADIVYGTNNEFAFDYLRDNLAYDIDSKVQRGFNFAIIDEVDSILIDEARTPLIISGSTEESTEKYYHFAKLALVLKRDEDYELDEKLKAITINQKGQGTIVNRLGLDPWAENDIDTTSHIESALKAKEYFRRDKEYVVKDGEIIIVDEFTGRMMPGRRWSHGLHQAIEAKEGLKVKPESKTYANITFQNYFRGYKKLSGMTGTALTSAEEFDKVYGLEVVKIPTNKPMKRIDMDDLVLKTERGKFAALVKEIKKRYEKGQPVLIGTVSIEKNEYLSRLLEKEGIPHQVLNAKHHEREGEIIAQAGRPGAVTIATNMAGRGVDIILGGNPQNEEDAKKAVLSGGLHVIGTERHEARRIDNQLRGRSGRQGDPGSSQFFVSLEDDLMRIFGGDKIKSLMSFLKVPEDEPIEAKMVSKSIESAQSKIEGHYFDARKHILDYDDVVNKHREVFYKKRETILQKHKEGTLKDYLLELIESAGFSKDDYLKKEEILGEEPLREAEKYVCLQTLDYFWMGHLDAMDLLKDQVRLRAYGQQDPLVEYKREGHRMFKELLFGIENTIADSLLKLERKPQIKVVRTKEESKINLSPFKREEKTEERIREEKKEKIGRNDPCPCGSGKKYKRCHGA